ncbi:MAG TPA: SMI1/KNR4 family protein [Tahibacter sp.]|jgi:hypothetical protein|nr:SMI1/KNR4 family protein [Tahibacter sp.]
MIQSHEIVAALVDGQICERSQIVGSSPQQIAALEQSAGAALPLAYRHFLAAAGEDAPGFFTGTSFFRSQIGGLHAAANALLEENGETVRLSADAFVFAMHQGYVFHYFLLSEGDDPPIYMYDEGNGPPAKLCDTYSEYLRDSIGWHVAMVEENRVQEAAGLQGAAAEPRSSGDG